MTFVSPFFTQTACAEQLQGRNCNVSDPVYTDPDKFLNRQKLTWIRLSITRDPRNRASFWAAKCAGFWPDQIYRYGSTFTRTSVNTWTVACKSLHRLRGKSLQPSFSRLLKRPAQCWPWQNFERSRVKITLVTEFKRFSVNWLQRQKKKSVQKFIRPAMCKRGLDQVMKDIRYLNKGYVELLFFWKQTTFPHESESGTSTKTRTRPRTIYTNCLRLVA